jgi:DNA helicase-2/ATP-dependent DNA helicase PcrA
MVVAGPGTGKTELLSMRAANILARTDTLPSNILCLTFTESGADAMRSRLADIIGPDAYKVAIHTFHSFGSEIINRNGDYFYSHAAFQPASELDIYQLLREIFDSLDHTNPLATTMNGEYTQLRDTIQVISELKKSGLTSDELLVILDDNERILDACGATLSEIFSGRVSKTTKDELVKVAHSVAQLELADLPPGIVSLVETLSLSIAHAVDAATDSDSTKPITAWRNKWLEKDEKGVFVFKDRRRLKKLRAISVIYYQYLLKMQERELYDFDDMVLRVVHALEVFSDLRFNLQEQYTYIMVDEFQDTNLAQSRLLRNLTDNPANEGAPNIMIVGDDDQAIYSFQGAEISNILQFKDLYETTKLVVLKENYRSSSAILDTAREVIGQGTERLEQYIPELDKTLNANTKPPKTRVELHEFDNISSERAWLAKQVAQDLKSGVPANEITVLARKHRELIDLLPYFAHEKIAVNYERRENVLDNEVVKQIELLARCITATGRERHDEANALLPELLSHPAWGITPSKLWEVSLSASREGKLWLEVMSDDSTLAPMQAWLIDQAAASIHTPLESMLDSLLGTAPESENDDTYHSPLYDYFFGSKNPSTDSQYLDLLDGLRTLRDHLRERKISRVSSLEDFLEFIELHKELGTAITTIRSASSSVKSAINLMTAHKAKGLEFDHVYVHDAIDSVWGERVRGRSRSISYPENLPLAPTGNDYNERLRLFFVAITRARHTLTISYSTQSDNGSSSLRASFLTEIEARPHKSDDVSDTERITQSAVAWYQPFVELKDSGLKEQLAPILERYQLSATHLNTFLDVTQGGPDRYLVHNLLRFPQAISPSAAYGSAIHRTLQRAHAHLSSTGKRRPLEDLLKDFETAINETPLGAKDRSLYLARGLDYLQQFLDHEYENFTASQQPELNFRYQQVQLGEARLTGSLDVADIDAEAKSIEIIDYKTGKASRSWNGKTDYEKIKLHKYRQQLMFYALLVKNSRDYSHLTPRRLALQFVEPSASGEIIALELYPSEDELATFALLVQAAWRRIISLELPDITNYPKNYKGILAFESDLLDGDG